MKPLSILILSLLLGSVGIAGTKLTVSCEVDTVADRIHEFSNPSTSFDTDDGYRDLVFEVYGSEIKVSVVSYMTADGKICGHKAGGICVNLNGSQFCTNDSHATVYPTSRYAQTGDKTAISCDIKGGEGLPCQ